MLNIDEKIRVIFNNNEEIKENRNINNKNKNLNEFTLRELKDDSSTAFNTRNKALEQNMDVLYLGVDNNNILYFKCSSGTQKNKYYIQKIQLLDLDKNIKLFKRNKKYKFRDIVKMSLDGDVKIYCSDPSFLYFGWEYINDQLDSGIAKEDREPVIRNPNLEGCMCKHLYLVIKKIPEFFDQIVDDFRLLKKK